MWSMRGKGPQMGIVDGLWATGVRVAMVMGVATGGWLTLRRRRVGSGDVWVVGCDGYGRSGGWGSHIQQPLRKVSRGMQVEGSRVTREGTEIGRAGDRGWGGLPLKRVTMSEG